MVKEGIPFVAVPLIIALILAYFHLWIPVGIFVFIALFMAFFFRDPRRETPKDDSLVISAADGKVTRIEETDLGKLVSVFLSPLDVHINRSPIAGTVKSVTYVAGKKMPATSNQASFINERNSLEIEGEKMTVVCTQIAGILARRIVCWSKEGDTLELGQKFGLIKFSSRTDLLMPKDVEVMVGIGDRVRGGETVIAKLK